MKALSLIIAMILSINLLEHTSYIGDRSTSSLGNLFAPIVKLFSPSRTNDLRDALELGEQEETEAQEVIVAVLDSGVNLSDEWIDSKIYRRDGIPQIFDVSNSSVDGKDDNGHGSQMISIILAINPNAKIVSIKCFGTNSSDLEGYSRGLELIKNQFPEVSVINISGGGAQRSLSEQKLIREMGELGKIVIAAAGNNGQNLGESTYYPASYDQGDHLVSVAGLGKSGDLASFSNYGSNIDFGILGENVPTFDHREKFVHGNGTSHATAIVSGLVSLIKGLNGEMNPAGIKELLRRASNPQEKLRHGRLDAKRALMLAKVAPLKNGKENLNYRAVAAQ